MKLKKRKREGSQRTGWLDIHVVIDDMRKCDWIGSTKAKKWFYHQKSNKRWCCLVWWSRERDVDPIRMNDRHTCSTSLYWIGTSCCIFCFGVCVLVMISMFEKKISHKICYWVPSPETRHNRQLFFASTVENFVPRIIVNLDHMGERSFCPPHNVTTRQHYNEDFWTFKQRHPHWKDFFWTARVRYSDSSRKFHTTEDGLVNTMPCVCDWWGFRLIMLFRWSYCLLVCCCWVLHVVHTKGRRTR